MIFVYLAGAIRDGVKADILWREEIIERCEGLASFLNPLAGTQYNSETQRWTAHGVESTPRLIVQRGFWAIDRADLVIFNFLALSEGYPNIGTLIEFGRATAQGCLIYSIVPIAYPGHVNAMYHLHPFIEENSAIVFPGIEVCTEFLVRELPVLSGASPHYNPYYYH